MNRTPKIGHKGVANFIVGIHTVVEDTILVHTDDGCQQVFDVVIEIDDVGISVI
jgi:hypothetical protein